MDFIHLLKTKDGIKVSIYIIFNLIFWIAIFCALLINFYIAGSIFLYEDNHDHHLAFFSYLGGMAKEGILPGIDFYSPHSVFIPIVIGIFFKFFGVSQVSLGISDGIIVFITMIFIYKCARLIMPSIFAKLAILTILLSHTGKDNPWFNDVIMLFVAIGIYFFALYFKLDKTLYKKISLIIVGIIVFMLPYMRQQGIVISFVFLALPLILFYTKQIKDCDKKMMLKFIISSFLIANFLFFIFIVIRNGFEGLEILYTSFGTLVDMAQPAIGYENNISSIANSIFNYTIDGMDWHGYSMKYLSYWFIIIIPCLYFLYQPLRIRFGLDSSVSNEDIIRFATSLVVLSTIVFNYPINEDARMRVQFGLGIWLFIDALRLCFYHKNIKLISTIFIAVVFLSINHSKITQFVDRIIVNYENIFHTKANYQKMPPNSPYKNMAFKDEYALHLNDLLYSIEDYHRKNPDTKIIFNGELVDINNYLFLLFSGPKVDIAHKFPYYYGTFNRKSVFLDIDDKFNQYLKENKPMIIDCEFLSDNLPDGYKILNKINNVCNILIPKDMEDKSA
ncbi:hypothetical protein [Helicobacter sp. MIT 99-5507]|uniref:hypothetical protein n=1 Tax=Helicobacter sp. MIT 99-5507 TaxID=152489 RepID=UPI000E1E8379|nr:hypothetical protein [Helicobacter sp. MIT 99-5507]RDU58000.1 hypothetical protein CQA42_03620 [Helicobacter sp. MIT 99-5507]